MAVSLGCQLVEAAQPFMPDWIFVMRKWSPERKFFIERFSEVIAVFLCRSLDWTENCWMDFSLSRRASGLGWVDCLGLWATSGDFNALWDWPLGTRIVGVNSLLAVPVGKAIWARAGLSKFCHVSLLVGDDWRGSMIVYRQLFEK